MAKTGRKVEFLGQNFIFEPKLHFRAEIAFLWEETARRLSILVEISAIIAGIEALPVFSAFSIFDFSPLFSFHVHLANFCQF